MTQLWKPSLTRIKSSSLIAFLLASKSGGSNISELHDWSIKNPEKFWSLVWDFCGIIGDKGASPYLVNSDDMIETKWFPRGSLNFTENLLKDKSSRTAIVFSSEEGTQRLLTYKDLSQETTRIAKFLKQHDIKEGDVVAGLLPNIPESVIGMLATTSFGGIWTSCSPDFGQTAIIDRFGQTTPKVLITTDSYYFKGEKISIAGKLTDILSAIPSIEHVVLISESNTVADKRTILWKDIPESSEKLTFTRVPFSAPLYIMYSSGTTGKPKCIVHSVGGTLLEHAKELVLHVDLKPTDAIFYQTSCSWMMWNWLVSSLMTGAKVVLYDGYPLAHDGKILWDIAQKEKITIFGTNAKYLSVIQKLGLTPIDTHDLSPLHTILSTGSPLLPEQFDYVYSRIKKDVCLSSISGGTDILGCFALGSPTLQVYRGELQTKSLGLKVEVFDDAGNSVEDQKGELVCTAPFPSQPIGFWNDPNNEKYKATYFSKFKNVWCHGDYVQTTQNGGMIFYGRSDTVLNPGGVRIGTAEIYRQIEEIQEIEDAIAVGQELNGDVRIILFVVLKNGSTLTDALTNTIKNKITQGASPYHVPKKIIAVGAVPKTFNGKLAEKAVADVIHGRPVTNKDSLVNPESLRWFENMELL